MLFRLNLYFVELLRGYKVKCLIQKMLENHLEERIESKVALLGGKGQSTELIRERAE